MAAKFEVIDEAPFEEVDLAGKVLKKVLVHVRYPSGLIASVVFEASQYSKSTRDRLIAEALKS